MIDAAQPPVVLAVPVEASGHDWFTLEWGEQWLEHVTAVKPAYAKVLIRDNPDFNAAEREGQFTRLAEVSSALTGAACRCSTSCWFPPRWPSSTGPAMTRPRTTVTCARAWSRG